MTWRVLYTQTVQDHIADHVAYLREQRVSPERIDDWFTRLFDAIDSLYEWPLRYPVAEPETAAMGFEVRKLNFGDYLVFYHVDPKQKLVEVLWFRHGARRRQSD